MKPCRIYVISWNQLEFTKLCLESLFKYTDPNVPITVIDNGSNGDVLNYLIPLMADGKITVIDNNENIGIAPSLNQGMKICLEKDTDFVFISNDIVVSPGWLERLREGVYKDERIGGGSPYISPECTYDSFANQSFRDNYKYGYWPEVLGNVNKDRLYQILDELHGGNYENFAENWIETRKNTPPLYEWFSMVMYIKKETIEKVGYFDEQFVPTHWEDLDYMVRMNNEGLFRVSVTDSYVFHWGMISHRSGLKGEIRENKIKADYNAVKFNKKWKIFKPDGSKYEPMEVGKLSPWPVSDEKNNRPYDKWFLWEPEKYPNIKQIKE